MAGISEKNPGTPDGFTVCALIAPVLGLFGGLIWAAGKITYPSYGYAPLAYFFGAVIGLAISSALGFACLSISRLRIKGASPKRGLAFAVNVPGLLCVFVVGTELATTARSHADAKRFSAYQSRLRDDLTVAVREHWDLSKDLQQYAALKYSLEDPAHVCAEDALRQIYAEFPRMQSYVLQNRGCSVEFLTTQFDDAYREFQQKGFESKLAGIMRNQNTPIDLIEKIAMHPTHLYEAGAAATTALKTREGRYLVRPGASLESIAYFQSLPAQTLLDLNPDVDFTHLRVGQSIRVVKGYKPLIAPTK